MRTFLKLSAGRLTQRLLSGDRGATAVEYSLIVVLIAAVIAGVVALVGSHVSSEFHSAVSNW